MKTRCGPAGDAASKRLNPELHFLPSSIKYLESRYVMANSDLSPTLIKAMAFHNAIASWKDLISNAKRRIDSIRELEKATGTDQSAQIAILESEIAIYQTVIEHTEARRKELLGVSESQ